MAVETTNLLISFTSILGANMEIALKNDAPLRKDRQNGAQLDIWIMWRRIERRFTSYAFAHHQRNTNNRKFNLQKFENHSFFHETASNLTV